MTTTNEWWFLQVDVELTDSDEEQIATLIREGFTSGIIYRDEKDIELEQE